MMKMSQRMSPFPDTLGTVSALDGSHDAGQVSVCISGASPSGKLSELATFVGHATHATQVVPQVRPCLQPLPPATFTHVLHPQRLRQLRTRPLIQLAPQ